MKPKVLAFDIETSLGLYAAYPSKKPVFNSSKMLVQDTFFICAAWQWEEGRRINSVSLLDDEKRFKKDHRDDYHIIKTLHEIISDADMVVGHNIKDFDWKRFLAKVIYYDLPPVNEKKFFDTLTMAKKASFSHNDLGHLARLFKVDEKSDHPKDMWMKCLRGDRKAIKEAVEYCKKDIPPTMSLYHKFKKYFPTQINHNLFRGDGVKCCPKCGHEELKRRGFRYTLTGKYQAYSCNLCRSWIQGKKNLKSVSLK